MTAKSKDLLDQDRLKKIWHGMQTPVAGNQYYALTLTASEDGKITWSAQTGFQGVTDTKPPRELRGPCLVDGEKMLFLWKKVGTPGVAVNNRTELVIFLHVGGNAIIETGLVQETFPDVLKPRVVVPTGTSTTTWIENVEPRALKHAPTPKLRMKVLKRDKHRCRICGRRPDTNVDIELHVHHFRPWALGGLTVEENLITLCHTCHKGLDPHFDMSLANIFPESYKHLNEKLNSLGTMEQEHQMGVKRFREQVAEIKTNTKNEE